MSTGVSARVNSRKPMGGADLGPVRLRVVVALLTLFTVVALYYAFTTVKAYDLSLQVSRGVERQRELLEAERRLKVELNHLRSPQRLEREGLRLGLVKPAVDQIRGLK